MSGLPGGSVVKNSPANAGDRRDTGLISALGRSPEKMATHSSVLAWEIPWTEEPGELPVHRVVKSCTQLSAGTHTHTQDTLQHCLSIF